MNHETAYLVGPIEKSSDHGVGWRSIITAKLEKIGIETIDPTNYWRRQKQTTLKEERGVIELTREKYDWRTLVQMMDRIWCFNEEAVAKSSFLIGNFCERVSSGGTIREMQKAFEMGKPTYIIYDRDPRGLNCHLLHLIFKKGGCFVNEDVLIEFLQKRLLR